MRLSILIQITDDNYKTLAARDVEYRGLRSQEGAIAAEVYDLSQPAGQAVHTLIQQMSKQIQADVVFARMAAEEAEVSE